jgi:hypothetical protein
MSLPRFIRRFRLQHRGIVERRVFTLYISLSLVGAIVLGYAFSLTEALL